MLTFLVKRGLKTFFLSVETWAFVKVKQFSHELLAHRFKICLKCKDLQEYFSPLRPRRFKFRSGDAFKLTL